MEDASFLLDPQYYKRKEFNINGKVIAKRVLQKPRSKRKISFSYYITPLKKRIFVMIVKETLLIIFLCFKNDANSSHSIIVKLQIQFQLLYSYIILFHLILPDEKLIGLRYCIIYLNEHKESFFNSKISQEKN